MLRKMHKKARSATPVRRYADYGHDFARDAANRSRLMNLARDAPTPCPLLEVLLGLPSLRSMNTRQNPTLRFQSERINFSSLVVERVVERLMINASKFALGTSHCTRHDLPLFPMAHTPGWGVEKGGLDHACVYKDL